VITNFLITYFNWL